MDSVNASVHTRLRLLSASRTRRGVTTITDFLDRIGDRRDHAFDVAVGRASARWFRAAYGHRPEQVVTYSRQGRPIHVNAYTACQAEVIAAGYADVVLGR